MEVLWKEEKKGRKCTDPSWLYEINVCCSSIRPSGRLPLVLAPCMGGLMMQKMSAVAAKDETDRQWQAGLPGLPG